MKSVKVIHCPAVPHAVILCQGRRRWRYRILMPEKYHKNGRILVELRIMLRRSCTMNFYYTERKDLLGILNLNCVKVSWREES